MKNYRIFVEKFKDFRVEAESLKKELNANLSLNIKELRTLNVYDLFGFTLKLLEESRYRVFGEVVTDLVSDECDLDGKKFIAVEYLPGQFDQRATSAIDCVRLIDPNVEVDIKSSKLLIFDNHVSDSDIERIKKYYINRVESREKDLTTLVEVKDTQVKPVQILAGFIDMQEANYEQFCKDYSLAMSADDLGEVVKYFKVENRNPYQTELQILDTYWSDHCRHTTFNSEITETIINESFIASELKESLASWESIRKELGRENKTLCLMDLATIGARYLRKIGLLDDMEQSKENNACSIFIDVDVDGELEEWLLLFKNETHNHPTEVEPFGGASTCLGGAIRDPLSGRSYVYQAMRVTGAGNIYESVENTLEGKLPQRVISLKAAAGYSSYGNQIGIATTHVREIYHPNYVAKRLEVGAVVGAVKASNVRRETPVKGDIILLLGGRTGRDGVGGATGSSKEHNVRSLEECSSEVQKGNAPEERKLLRLFRREEVTRLIKKSNDFGAGGVSVAVGELTDGLDIYLDRMPTKYNGLNHTELAISESQERMAVVIEAKDREEFESYCRSENVEVTYVADVTDTNRMRMFYNGERVVDLSREFIDSAGAKRCVKACIGEVADKNPFEREIEGATVRDRVLKNLESDNVVSQKGLIEMFDSTVGASTVLMPFGGKTQNTETQVSVQKIPVGNHHTTTASIMAYGYNPDITSWSPYHGAAYAIVEAISKVVAAGASYEKMRFSYQEYFERMSSEISWGKPLAALLGALKMQVDFKLPAIGGKDSMSGSFGEINVPPMLMAFGITTVDTNRVISPEFKKPNNHIYIIKHTPKENYMPNVEQLQMNYKFIEEMIGEGVIVSAYAVGFGGVCEAVAKMMFGNEIGANLTINESDLFDYNYGSIVVESNMRLNDSGACHIGETIVHKDLIINGECIGLDLMLHANGHKFTKVYPDKLLEGKFEKEGTSTLNVVKYEGELVDEPIAYIPVFPGTNCDYDMAKSFDKAGAKITTTVFCNLNGEDILNSIAQMKKHIDECHIFVLSGGFSVGDEPDGSGKFIANILNNSEIAEAINGLIARRGLILGICNGFQALVKSGLLPYGKLGEITTESPTLFRNDINRHISHIVSTRVSSVASPWLNSFRLGEIHSIAVSHGEGKFVVNENVAQELFKNGQVAFQYVDIEGNATTESPCNPNGSNYAIEGIISPDGRILGKMGHSERYHEGGFKNVSGNKIQDIYKNGVNYFKKLN